jgi:hypothetical protein
MKLLPLLWKGADLVLGAVEVGTNVYDRARKLWRGQPAPASAPLTWRDAEIQATASRNAGHEKKP